MYYKAMKRSHQVLAASALLCLFVAPSAAATSGQPKLLVLMDDMAMQQSHSKFLQSVKARGYDMEIASVDAKSINLREWDDWLYDKLIILGGSKKLSGGGLKPSVVTQFYDAGHDVLLALAPNSSSQLRTLAQDLGVDAAPAGTLVIDHFYYPESAAVMSGALPPLPAVFSSTTKGPVMFKGVALTIPDNSEVAFPALTATPTSFSAKPGEEVTGTLLAGPAIVLVALVQGRHNNARAAVLGSVDMLSDSYFTASHTNVQFAADVSRWAFSERGVLKASGLRHRVVGGEESPAIYRVSDDVEVEVDIAECAGGKCKPFRADDVQLEFVMLDPHVRTTLTQNGNGTFSAAVKVPDVYGVFKWVVDYRRPGYSWVSLTQTVPVRPFRHDEYERFIVQAYPYYTSAASMMAGFFAVGFYFLYSK